MATAQVHTSIHIWVCVFIEKEWAQGEEKKEKKFIQKKWKGNEVGGGYGVGGNGGRGMGE